MRAGMRTGILGAALLTAGAAIALAQDGGIVARYPEPATVAADYTDDAERYMAFKVLFDDLGEKTRGTRTPGAYERDSAYHRGLSDVAAKYNAMAKDSAAHVAYSQRIDRLFTDAAFRKAVLDRYGVSAIAAPLPAASAPAPAPAPGSGDVTDAMIQDAFLRASPFALAGLAAMVLLSRALTRNSSAYPSDVRPAPPAEPGVPALPESLRVVTLPGASYCVETASGVVIEKETTIRTTVHTSTSGGEAYTVGNTVHTTPVQTSTSVATHQDDLVWVRTAAGREEAWAFGGGTFRARRGQILSVVTRPLRDGTADRLVAFNHATGQLEWCAGLGRAHSAASGPAWWTSAFVGSLGFAAAFWVVVGIGPDPIRGPAGVVAVWIGGAFVASILAFVTVGLAQRRIGAARSKAFESAYAPGWRRFLEGSTPALEARLAPS